jgi:hypothetical protein
MKNPSIAVIIGKAKNKMEEEYQEEKPVEEMDMEEETEETPKASSLSLNSADYPALRDKVEGDTVTITGKISSCDEYEGDKECGIDITDAS